MKNQPIDLGKSCTRFTICLPRYCPFQQKALVFFYFDNLFWLHGQCAWLRQGCGRGSLQQPVGWMLPANGTQRVTFTLLQGCTIHPRRTCSRPYSTQCLKYFTFWSLFLDAVALETGFRHTAQAGFEFTIPLSQLPGCWDYRFVLPCTGFLKPFSENVCPRHGVPEAVSWVQRAFGDHT